MRRHSTKRTGPLTITLFVWMAGSAATSPWSMADLIERLYSDSAATAASACQAIERMGPDGHPAVETLVGLLDDDRCIPDMGSCVVCNRMVRDQAVAALAAIGPAAQSAVPYLWKRFESAEAPQTSLLSTLALIEGAHILVPLLSDTRDAYRTAAATSLANALSRGAAITLSIEELAIALRPLLRARGAERDAGICVIAEVNSTAPFIAQDLVESVAGRSGNYPAPCEVDSLVAMGNRVVPMVAPLLNSRRWHIRRTAETVLKELDPTALDPVGPLPDDATQAVAVLTRILEAEPQPETLYLRIVAAERLAEYGIAGEPALFGLAMLLTDTDSQAGSAAINAIESIGEPAVLDLLDVAVGLREEGNLFRSTRPEITDLETFRIRVLTALGKLGQAAESAIPELLISSRDSNPDIRGAAARALGDLGLANQEVYSRLVEIVESDRWASAYQPALDSIAMLAPIIDEATPFLVQIASSDSPVADRVPYLLAKSGNSSAPHLILLLMSENSKVSRAACGAVTRLENPPTEVTDLSFELLTHTDSTISSCGRGIVHRLVDTRPDLILDHLLGSDQATAKAVRSVIVSRSIPKALRDEAEMRGEVAVSLIEELNERIWKRPITIP